MRAVRAWLRRLGAIVGAGPSDRELHEELEAHLQMHIDDNRRLGMSAAEARRRALIRLGGVEQTKEQYRDRRGLPSLDTAFGDLRFALRMMRRSRGFTAVVLSTLAIGIGANAIMFSVVNTVLLRPLPYREPAGLVSVRTVDSRRQPAFTAAPDFYAYRSQNTTLESLEAFYFGFFNLTGSREPERIPGLIVSAGLFSALGLPPASGRGFVAQDEQWGSHRVVILTEGLWRRRFGGDSRLVGQAVTMNGEPYEVVGILPPGFSFMGLAAELFVPMAFEPGDHMNSHSNYFLRMIGRLNAGVTRERAIGDLNRISEAIIAEQSVNHGTTMDVVPLRDMVVGRDVRRSALVLLGAVGFVLLICCANLANLLLARAAVRQREIAVRLALGASRARLVRQFLVESLLLAFAGGAAGLGLAYVSADALNAVSQRVLPRASDIRVDPTVLLFTFAVATIAGILLGLAPAAQHVGTDVNQGLKTGARTACDGLGRQRVRSVLVVAEVALSLVLLVGAGLMVKSMYQLLHVDAGFSAEGVLTAQINLPAQKYVDRRLERQLSPLAYTRSVAFFTDAIDRVRSIPGAAAVGAINGLPLMGEVWGKNVTFYDRPLPADFRGLSPIQYRVVAGDYFRAMGIRIVSGRSFTDNDTLRAPKVAIVNRELVRRHWNGEDPLGKIISVNPPLQVLPKSVIEEARRAGTLPENYEPDRFAVVGVAEDTHYGGLQAAALPLVYVPFAQGSEGTMNMFLTVRTEGEPLALTGAIREQIAQLDRDQPIANVQTMAARLSASVAQPRMQMNLLGLFAALAAALAAIGIYGVMSYAVTQRAREIGVRVALGAARRDVVGLVLRQGFTMVAVGLGIGTVGALLITRVLRTLLFEVSPTDVSVFAAIVCLLTLTAWLAAYLPARRAARLDPLVVLRSE
jgi:putative ABC transport system permease protein